MPRKSYNSDSARKLAQSYKITLSKIPATRPDLKITVKNIKDYTKETGLSKVNKTEPKKFQQKGYHVKIVIEPRGAEDIDLTGRHKNHNLDELVKYYKSFLPSVGFTTDYFRNEKVSKTTVKGIGRIVFDFDVPILNTNEVDFVIQMATDLDDDGNYPIHVLNGRIVSIDARNLSRDVLGVTLLREHIISKKITPI
jgi:hypothetical protein